MKYLNIILSFCLAVVLTGCLEDMVDTEPTTSFEASEMIVDESTAKLAVNGIYSSFQSDYVIGGYWQMSAGVYADNINHTGTYPDMAELGGNAPISSNIYVLRIWRDLYRTIFRANTVITSVNELPEDKITPEGKTQILAEAKFMRALCYFRLVNLFGGVPIVLEPIEDDYSNMASPRKSEAEVYTQIKSDIAGASELSGSDVFKATPAALKALKAKVHLYLKEYDEALAEAQFFDPDNAANPFSLVGDYTALWNPGGDGNTEAIFMIKYSKDDQNSLAWFFDNIAGRYEVGPSAKLLSLLASDGGDRSKLVEQQGRDVAIIKYTDTGTGTDQPYVYRYADMLLLLAEAAIESADDYNYATGLVNRVRQRSNVGTVTLTADNWKEILMKERSVELFAEGNRWIDIRRAGIAEDVISNKPATDWDAVKDSYMYWPIPQDEIDANSELTQADQNPGY